MENSSLLANTSSLSDVENMLKLDAQLFKKLGFSNKFDHDPDQKRQIIFDNQILTDITSLSLSVVLLENSSRTFNFEYRCLPGKTPHVQLQNRLVKSTNIQLIENPEYRQIMIQVYFLQPINYQSEDLVFSVKVEKTSTGSKLKTGISWLNPEIHISSEAALELTRQICDIIS